MQKYFVCIIPAPAKIVFMYSLSMATLEDKTPQPTYGISTKFNSPCIEPSSPPFPRNTGNTQSKSFKNSIIFFICFSLIGSSPNL